MCGVSHGVSAFDPRGTRGAVCRRVNASPHKIFHFIASSDSIFIKIGNIVFDNLPDLFRVHAEIVVCNDISGIL